MQYHYFLLLLITFILVSCEGNRPDGEDVEEFLEHINRISKPLPKGDHNEYYALLSKDFISSFENEIDKAKKLDSVGLRKLPKMEMLRILSLKNSFAEIIKESDTKTIITNWLESAGKGFPLKNSERFYYTTKSSLESKMLNEGKTFPMVLISKERNKFTINPFNTKEYQEKRINNILKKQDLNDLIKESAWLHFQTQRRINWKPIL